jgi:alpha-ketoglutarate-dependent taurine dioxygenase
MIDGQHALGGVLTPETTGTLEALDQSEVWSLLDQYGALLFRGFDFDIDGFIQFTSRFTVAFGDYRGGGFRMRAFDREAVQGDPTVMTTTGGTQSFGLPLHGELYYQNDTPDLIWFHCVEPPPAGGQTTLGWGTAIFADCAPETRRYFSEHPVVYTRRLDREGWSQAFQTTDISEAIAFAFNRDLEAEYDREHETLITKYRASAVQKDRVNGQPSFINGVLILQIGEWAFKKGIVAQYLGDNAPTHAPFVVRTLQGDPLPEAVLDDAFGAAERHTVNVAWRPGDVLMIDNRRVLHGRREVQGQGRRIICRMGARRHAA